MTTQRFLEQKDWASSSRLSVGQCLEQCPPHSWITAFSPPHCLPHCAPFNVKTQSGWAISNVLVSILIQREQQGENETVERSEKDLPICILKINGGPRITANKPILGSSALSTELIFTCPWTPHYLSYLWFLLPRDVQGDWRNPNGRISPRLSLHLDLKELWDFCAFPASFIFNASLFFPYNQEVRPLRQSASLLDAPVKGLCKVPAWLVLNTIISHLEQGDAS